MATYDQIESFMRDYFRDHTASEQEPAALEAMAHYWAPDMAFHPYVSGDDPIVGLEAFMAFNDHPPIKEVLRIDRLTIDERKLVADVHGESSLVMKETGEVKFSAEFHATYTLRESGDRLQIELIQWFFEVNPQTARVTEVLYSQ